MSPPGTVCVLHHYACMKKPDDSTALVTRDLDLLRDDVDADVVRPVARLQFGDVRQVRQRIADERVAVDRELHAGCAHGAAPQRRPSFAA